MAQEPDRHALFAFVLSVVRDFALAERMMGEPQPREAALKMKGIALRPEAIAAVERAALKESSTGWLDAVRTCVEGADRRTRSLLEMRYRHGMSGAEIARRTKTTATAVHASLFRVRASLAKCVEGRLAAVRE